MVSQDASISHCQTGIRTEFNSAWGNLNVQHNQH